MPWRRFCRSEFLGRLHGLLRKRHFYLDRADGLVRLENRKIAPSRIYGEREILVQTSEFIHKREHREHRARYRGREYGSYRAAFEHLREIPVHYTGDTPELFLTFWSQVSAPVRYGRVEFLIFFPKPLASVIELSCIVGVEQHLVDLLIYVI